MAADWHAYRKCPTCLVATGTACKSLSGTVVGGHPDKHEKALSEPHTRRPIRGTKKWREGLAERVCAEISRRDARAHA